VTLQHSVVYLQLKMLLPWCLAAKPQATQGGAPSRREALFGLLGAGLGVGLTTAYFKGGSVVRETWVGWAHKPRAWTLPDQCLHYIHHRSCYAQCWSVVWQAFPMACAFFHTKLDALSCCVISRHFMLCCAMPCCAVLQSSTLMMR
jgi:hypothetical protein